jgi:hypothetical protein
MKLETFTYDLGRGWSVPSLPALDSPQTLLIVFGSSKLVDHQQSFAELRNVYPNSHIVGCSTAGEIHGTSVADQTLVVGAIEFASTKVYSASAAIQSVDDSYRAGESLAERLYSPDLKSLFVLTDGIHVNGSELIRGLNDILPNHVIVTGGMAGDGERFEQTWVIKDGQAQSGCVSAVGLYGDAVRVGHGSKGGWDIFGPERRVSRSDGSVLYELDGKPALQLYKEYLGERAQGLPATALLFPLALRSSSDDPKKVVRTVLGVDEAQQAMIFAGDIPEGALAQLMKANFDRLIDGASIAAQAAVDPLQSVDPVLSIAISCVGRRMVLGERSEEELEATLEALPPWTRQIGFYSYGEISPYGTGYCDLHNQTMTLTTISEV